MANRDLIQGAKDMYLGPVRARERGWDKIMKSTSRILRDTGLAMEREKRAKEREAARQQAREDRKYYADISQKNFMEGGISARQNQEIIDIRKDNAETSRLNTLTENYTSINQGISNVSQRSEILGDDGKKWIEDMNNTMIDNETALSEKTVDSRVGSKSRVDNTRRINNLNADLVSFQTEMNDQLGYDPNDPTAQPNYTKMSGRSEHMKGFLANLLDKDTVRAVDEDGYMTFTGPFGENGASKTIRWIDQQGEFDDIDLTNRGLNLDSHTLGFEKEASKGNLPTTAALVWDIQTNTNDNDLDQYKNNQALMYDHRFPGTNVGFHQFLNPDTNEQNYTEEWVLEQLKYEKWRRDNGDGIRIKANFNDGADILDVSPQIITDPTSKYYAGNESELLTRDENKNNIADFLENPKNVQWVDKDGKRAHWNMDQSYSGPGGAGQDLNSYMSKNYEGYLMEALGPEVDRANQAKKNKTITDAGVGLNTEIMFNEFNQGIFTHAGSVISADRPGGMTYGFTNIDDTTDTKFVDGQWVLKGTQLTTGASGGVPEYDFDMSITAKGTKEEKEANFLRMLSATDNTSYRQYYENNKDKFVFTDDVDVVETEEEKKKRLLLEKVRDDKKYVGYFGKRAYDEEIEKNKDAAQKLLDDDAAVTAINKDDALVLKNILNAHEGEADTPERDNKVLTQAFDIYNQTLDGLQGEQLEIFKKHITTLANDPKYKNEIKEMKKTLSQSNYPTIGDIPNIPDRMKRVWGKKSPAVLDNRPGTSHEYTNGTMHREFNKILAYFIYLEQVK